ncbi:MAG: diacylglycerol kinase family lipid kinase [Acidobacteria bacterium]|nr:diacylglycerol kinase family lipid kinase [Acidobacteriota bacterium]
MQRPYSNGVLIYNPEAGSLRKRCAELIRQVMTELERAGIAVTPCSTTGPGTGEPLARQAVQSGADLIVVCGGDGTINEVVCGMAHSHVPLAVLPGGTANGLGRELRLPRNLRAAAQCIASAQPRRIPLGRVGGQVGERYFLLMAGIGLDALVISRLPHQWKRRLGMAGYFLEAVRQGLLGPLKAFVISSEGKRLSAAFACISKAQYYGPLRMTPEANIFSETFYVYSFPPRSRFRYFLYGLALLAGQLKRFPEIGRFPARKIQCEASSPTSPPIFFQVDGELAGQLPCTVELVPDALTLLVPAPSPVPETERR